MIDKINLRAMKARVSYANLVHLWHRDVNLALKDLIYNLPVGTFSTYACET